MTVLLASHAAFAESESSPGFQLDWQSLPDLPDSLGVAGPLVGVHHDALIVAGGANFPQPVWEHDKVWKSDIHVLTKQGDQYHWKSGGNLPQKRAYGAAVTTPYGIVCMGGNDAERCYADTFLMTWNPEAEEVQFSSLPSLPSPCAYGQATLIGDVVYLAGGQSGLGLDTAMANFWSLDLGQLDNQEKFKWIEHDSWPGPPRAFNITASQHNGFANSVYVISGRTVKNEDTNAEPKFLTDVWEYSTETKNWRSREDVPHCVMAGTGIGLGQSHILVMGGADGSLFSQTDELRDAHPGFPKEALAYHTITNTWTSAGPTPMNQVTTIPVEWNGDIILASGEIRPRVRTPKVWAIQPISVTPHFGMLNYFVLFGYLLAMVGIGVYFARKNKNTDDYFRGGKHIPWWAAGCSIFATMLSSLTYTGIPSKAYAQDWVYLVGNMMIPVVAFVAVYLALPCFRTSDVTSAYEFLEKRFNRNLRLFGSVSFLLFHLFRMAVVMSLTGLALAVATPLTPYQAVLLIGVLSMIYCTMGGIEAVIWTDTIQTVVLLGGAVLAIALLISGSDGGLSTSFHLALDNNKLSMVNWAGDISHSRIVLWVIIVGALGQNLASYTSDQAVVQRYMTTPTAKLAARSIWTNAVMVIPATFLFFTIGTALFAYYHSHPDKLDPTLTADQIFPMFISREMPVGIAGLIVAGIFSAAQSTISTSMNSMATTSVTDLLRPYQFCKTERGYLRSARWLTFGFGGIGTGLGLLFVDPSINSLFDTFIKLIGLFMGVLGGLFLLGMLTKRANSTGATCGALCGTLAMISMAQFTNVNGYLYTTVGIGVCMTTGYLISLLTSPSIEGQA
ncbi:sodium:solute symporter family transporter [Calycomorphotria hydatis]